MISYKYRRPSVKMLFYSFLSMNYLKIKGFLIEKKRKLI
jgi:hypothetical protein